MSIGSDALSSYPLSSSGGEVVDLNVTVSADGFLTTGFGAPRVVFNQIGWLATAFGSTVSISNRIVQASGWDVAPQFGIPGQGSAVSVSGFLATAFGTAKVYPQLAYGFKPTLFGKPHGFSIAPARTVVYPATWVPTRIGTPRTVIRQGASGFSPTTFGQPASFVAHRHTGFSATSFGLPGSGFRLASSGFLAAKIGTAFGYATVFDSGLLSVDSVSVMSRTGQIHVLTR